MSSDKGSVPGQKINKILSIHANPAGKLFTCNWRLNTMKITCFEADLPHDQRPQC